MPCVDIRLAGPAMRERKTALMADAARSLVERLGALAGAVQGAITGYPSQHYGANRLPVAGREANPATRLRLAAQIRPATQIREDANVADPSR